MSCLRAAVVATLCVVLVEQPVMAEGRAEKRSAKDENQIQGDTRVLHALNRFTFGPRPGDVAKVKAMGLNRWFETQLNPGRIDDAQVEARLAEYPAMQLSIDELRRRYPGPQAIKAMIDGRIALPSDPTERILAQDHIAFYERGKAKQAAAMANAKADAKQEDTSASSADSMAKQTPGLAGKPAAGEVAAPVDPAAPVYSRDAALRLFAEPPTARMQSILAMSPAELIQFRQSLKPAELEQLGMGMTPQQRETLAAIPGAVRMVALESVEARLTRDIYSDRQLEAVMTDFWLNHFNVYLHKNQQEPYLIPSYERDTIRPLALGNFEDLLVATAKSPAMLVYLDNFRSIGPDSLAATRGKRVREMHPDAKLAKQRSAGLNENYGRELMELHTLGVSGGYTQADVTQVAKVFTGWTLEPKNQRGPDDDGGYLFDEKKHEPGDKVVLGKTIHEAGEKEGLEVLHLLATSPATAHFISQKLAVRFVSDTPPQALVDQMAKSFLKSHGDIKTVLRTMFAAPEFWSPAVDRAKVKTPLEFVVSVVRAGGVEVKNPQALVASLDRLGMPLYGMQTPNGYSWMKEDWVGTGALVSRLNFALALSGDKLPGTQTDWAKLLGEVRPAVLPVSYAEAAPESAAEKERKLEQMLLNETVSERTRATVLAQSNDTNATEQAAMQFDLRGGVKNKGAGIAVKVPAGPPHEKDDAQAAVMAGLLLGSPEFQRR